MRIAFVGVETSHPFSDARNLEKLAPEADFVVCGRRDRVASFVEEHPRAGVREEVADVIRSAPDVAVVSLRPDEVAGALGPLCAARIPVFVNKPAAVTAAQVDAIAHILESTGSAFLTGSVLSFAPIVTELSIDRARLVSVEATLRHDVAWWHDPDFAWQDSGSGARGLVPVIGVHAFDVLAATVGSDFEVEAVHGARRSYPELEGGDAAQLLLRFSDGLGATVQLIGASSAEQYEFSFHSAQSTTRVIFPDASDDPFGYLATASQILLLAGGEPAPRPWRQSIDVLRQLSRAGDLARTSLAGGAR